VNRTWLNLDKFGSYGKLILEERIAWGSLKLALGVEKLSKIKSGFKFFVGQHLL
jgi:hypothetical protein